MSKKIVGNIKLQIQAGKANPSPPVGPALGQHGVNIMEFCKSFNAKTQEQSGQLIPVEITVFADRSFTFITKTPPTSFPCLWTGQDFPGWPPNRCSICGVFRPAAQFTPHTDSTLSIARHVGERHWKGMDEQWHAAQPEPHSEVIVRCRS